MNIQTEPIQNFIGQGIVLPIELVNGRPPLESGFKLLRSSIMNILSWDYSNRFFLNEFGSLVSQLLEEPNDSALEEVIRVFVIQAIENWEPRVELSNATINRGSETSINITVTYKIVNTKKEDTFTFPFYKKIIY